MKFTANRDEWPIDNERKRERESLSESTTRSRRDDATSTTTRQRHDGAPIHRVETYLQHRCVLYVSISIVPDFIDMIAPDERFQQLESARIDVCDWNCMGESPKNIEIIPSAVCFG